MREHCLVLIILPNPSMHYLLKEEATISSFFLFSILFSIEHNFILKFRKWINNIKIEDIIYVYG